MHVKPGDEATRDWTDEERESVRSSFKKWDTDQNGTISLEELQAVFCSLGMSSDEVKALFDTLGCDEVDYEGLLDWLSLIDAEKMVQATQKPSPARHVDVEKVDLPLAMGDHEHKIILSSEQFQVFEEAFNILDSNADGTLGRQELTSFLADQCAASPTPEMVDRYMAKFEHKKVDLLEWMHTIIGKQFAVSTHSLETFKVESKYKAEDRDPLLDCEEKPIVIGFWYTFISG